MLKNLIISFLLMQFLALSAQDKPAYVLVDANGKKATWGKVIAGATSSDVVCFGELHNNPIAHWLELELMLGLMESGKNVVVGMEMFERHQQPWLDRLYAGETNADAIQDSADVWPNFATDYKPIVVYSHEYREKIRVVATNVPRKYASMVAKRGLQSLDSLPAAEKALMAPLPLTIDYELASYQEMMAMMAGHGHGMKAEHFVAAQALKDATMAHFLLAARHPEAKQEVLLHLNGSFHSDRKEGIVWYLKRAQPGLNILTITVVEQASTARLEAENKGLADFIIIVPERMTKTYE